MKRSTAAPQLLLLAVLASLIATGCRHATPGERAEAMARYLATSLDLDASQTAQLETMKEEFLARRPIWVQMRKESYDDAREMMLSPGIDQDRLKNRLEKIKSETDAMILFLGDNFIELHDLLTPEQRSKLVQMMEKHNKRHDRW